MGYYLTAEPENAVPGKSWATPKTHVPGSPVKERGHRYYMPETGRWTARDPLGESAFVQRFITDKPIHERMRVMRASAEPAYLFVNNNPSGAIDALGLASVAIYDGSDNAEGGGADSFDEKSCKSKKKKCRGLAKGAQFKAAAADYDHDIDVGSTADAVTKLQALVSSGVVVDDLYVIDHGSAAWQELGNGGISATYQLGQSVSVPRPFRDLGALVKVGGTIHLMGCSVAAVDGGMNGPDYLQNLADEAGRKVTACDDSVTYVTLFGQYLFNYCSGSYMTKSPGAP